MSSLSTLPNRAPSPARQDPELPSIQECCPNCARMQELMNQFAQIADTERRRAESYATSLKMACQMLQIHGVPKIEPKAA